MNMDLKAIRKKFPILLEKGAFLNHAATAPLSYATVETMKKLCEQMTQPIDSYYDTWMSLRQKVRLLIAELLHCSSDTIALTPNTSTSLSLVARCLDLKEGDRILIPSGEFPSNRYVWQNLQNQGIFSTFFDLDPQRSLIETLKKQDLRKVRLISVSLVDYSTGRKHDLEAFGNFCQKRGIISCVDGIQGVGTFPIDLEHSNIDFFAGGGQKWLLGPVGCGYLYIRKELISKIQVPLVGWPSVLFPEEFETKELNFANDARRFEAGISNLAIIGGFCSSLQELKKIGWNQIYKQIAWNARYLRKRLNSLVSLSDESSALVSFKLSSEIDKKRLLRKMNQARVKVTLRHQIIRVSPHFYNTQEELDLALKVIYPWVSSNEKRGYRK